MTSVLINVIRLGTFRLPTRDILRTYNPSRKFPFTLPETAVRTGMLVRIYLYQTPQFLFNYVLNFIRYALRDTAIFMSLHLGQILNHTTHTAY